MWHISCIYWISDFISRFTSQLYGRLVFIFVRLLHPCFCFLVDGTASGILNYIHQINIEKTKMFRCSVHYRVKSTVQLQANGLFPTRFSVRAFIELRVLFNCKLMGCFPLILVYVLCSLLKTLTWLWNAVLTARKTLFPYSNLRLSVIFSSLSCSFTSIISILTMWRTTLVEQELPSLSWVNHRFLLGFVFLDL